MRTPHSTLHTHSLQNGGFRWHYAKCFSHAHSTLSHYGVVFTGVTQNVFRTRTTPHSPRSGFRWHYAKCFSLVRRKKNHSPRAENTPLSHATAKSTSSTPGVFSMYKIIVIWVCGRSVLIVFRNMFHVLRILL